MEVLKKINNLKNLSKPAKASIVLMLTQIIQKGLSIITAPVYTRLLSTEEYGTVSLFFSWYEILIIFTSFCLSKGVFNNGMMDYKDDRDCFTWSMCSLGFTISIVVGTAVLAFTKFVYNFMNLPYDLICYMFVLLTFEEVLSIWTVKQRFEYKYKFPAIITVGIAVISPICGVLGILLFSENKIYARIIGARNVFLIVYLGIFIYLAYKTKGRIKAVYWKYAIKFNLPLIPHYLSLHILNHMDRIMISSIVGTGPAGIYSVAYNGASVVKIFWQSVNSSLIPWTYEKCEQEDFKSLAELTKMLLLGYSLICIAFMFLAPEIMKILAPASYHEGIYVIPSVIAGVYFSALYYIFANVCYYYKQPKYVMIGSVVSAIANIVLNAIFIPIFGYFAAGYTTMFSYILQVLIDYWSMKRILKKDIYDMKFILGLSIVVILIGILLSFIYTYSLIRWIVFVMFCVYVISYLRKNLNQYKLFFSKKK